MKKGYPLIFFFALSVCLLFFHFSLLEAIEWRGYDFEMRHAARVPLLPQIAFVNIDANSITPKMPWPYRPAIYSQFLDQVEKGKPALVYLDILLQAAPEISQTGFQSLVKKMRAYGNIILPLNLSRGGVAVPLSPTLEKSVAAFGIPFMDEDPDGRVRRAHLLWSYPGGVIPSIPLILAGGEENYLHAARPAFNPRTKKFDWTYPGKKIFASTMPLSQAGELARYIPYWDPARRTVGWNALKIITASNQPDMLIFFTSAPGEEAIPFWKILKQRINPGRFDGKIVIVYSSNEISDSYYTPLSKSFRLQEKMPGGEVIGEAVNTILTRSFIRYNPGLELGCALFLLIFFLLILSRFGALKGILLYLVPISCYLLLAYFLFTRHFIWIGWTRLALSSALLFTGSLVSERLRIFRMMSLLIPKKMAQKLEAGGLKLGGEEVPGTAMFVDLQGYTSLAEKMPLQEAFKTLKEFHEKVEKLAGPLGGTICDWQGDGVLIFFSEDPATPSPVSHPEEKALEVALEMKQAFTETKISAGIGIASGKVLWGFLGTSSKAQPSAIGDPVNLASRLQGVGKRLGTVIAVDQGTFLAAKESFDWEEQGAQMVRGKTDPVLVYTPTGKRGKRR